MTEYYAHSIDNPDQSLWQLLSEHLCGVAKLARQFAEMALLGDAEFAETAYTAGLLHDLGKYREEFQQLLRGSQKKSEQTRHKQAGTAKAAVARRLDVAFAIGGHHGGLPDSSALKELVAAPGGRDVAERVWEAAIGDCPELNHQLPKWPGNSDPLQFDIWVRLLFSCLVDADWQDTGEFHCKARNVESEPRSPELTAKNIDEMFASVLAYIASRAKKCRDEKISRVRREILDAALEAAILAPGIFTMTVPTGGGKTLSSLAFALAHARHHRLRRVIYVAPYLSIIEQNAREIRRALQVDPESQIVFEHHSLAEPPGGPDADEMQTQRRARQAESWDAPVVLTTSVQFFESLFSNAPGQCRKLHNVARSVVILDECQTLPPGLVAPTCSMLSTFAEMAACSFVLCTATQPAWLRRSDLPEGLSGVREIAPPELRLFDRLRRVRIQWPKPAERRLNWQDVAERMVSQPGALCVVNTKTAARNVYNRLRQSGCDDALHLSTLMCPTHRLEILDEVRRRLVAGETCRLVSTQLIEAGVDVDFPLVLREMAPLEAIIQAAGRCNREGLLNFSDGRPGGNVLVFRSENGSLPPDRWYKAGIATLEQDFLMLGKEPDIALPDQIQEYFHRLYKSGSLDQFQIEDLRRRQQFATVNESYRIVDSYTVPVVVAMWDGHREEIDSLLETLRRTPNRKLFRHLHRFQVNLRSDELSRISSQTEEGPDGVSVYWGPYDKHLGLSADGSNVLLPV